MSAIDVQVRFAAEFALFLVSLAGLGFSFLRADLLVVRPLARAASGVGFACLAAAAFCSGALILDDPDDALLFSLRFGGIILIALASTAWRPDRGGRELLRIGVVFLAVAEVIVLSDAENTTADLARGLGAIAVGACLVGASARVISARIAASGALVLFAVITVVAVALSTIVSDNIEDEALRRYSARAQTEAAAITTEPEAFLASAQLLSETLVANAPADVQTITDPDTPIEAATEERDAVAATINELVRRYVRDVNQGPTFVIDLTGRVVLATPADEGAPLAREISGQPAVNEARSVGGAAQVDVALVGGQLVRIAAQPLETRVERFGVLVRTSRISDSYLQQRVAALESEVDGASIAVAHLDGRIASAGAGLDDEVLRSLVAEVIEAGEDLERTAGDRFYAAYPIEASRGTVAAVLVLSAPRAEEDATREDLFRVLFIVAMGAATAALVLAGVAGERIGAGLRRLSEAAAAIQAGNLDARADVRTDDELGALGRSFDAMAASIGDLTRELRTAAVDEAALRGRLEAVVAGMGEALVAVDAEGTITDFNAAAERLFDVPARAARGRPITEVVDLRNEDGHSLARRLRRPVLQGWGTTGSVRIHGGREIPVSVSAGTLRGPGGEVAGAVFVVSDERRERELDRMKTEFLANISHELRTPLTGIKGYAGTLLRRDLRPDQARAFAAQISSSADELERVIGQLVNFSTIVGGKLTVNPAPTAIRPFVDKVLRPWRDRISGSHRLVRRVAAGLPAVPLDETYLAQALEALLDNALKYSPDGGKIVVSAAMVDGEDGRELEITVSDEGVGIPADRIDTVVEDFSQADASATRRFGGLGLGLALVNRIVRAHGGRVQVSSTVGSGTTVALRLPAPDAERAR